MKSFVELKAEIDAQVASTVLEPDRDVKDLVRYNMSTLGCGYPQDNQIFTTWIYGTADCGYITDWCYFLIELANDKSYTMEELCRIARFWFIQPSHFAEYAGLRKQYYFTKEIDKIMDTLVQSIHCEYQRLGLSVFPVGHRLCFHEKRQEVLRGCARSVRINPADDS